MRTVNNIQGKGRFPVSCNFHLRTHVKITFEQLIFNTG